MCGVFTGEDLWDENHLEGGQEAGWGRGRSQAGTAQAHPKGALQLTVVQQSSLKGPGRLSLFSTSLLGGGEALLEGSHPGKGEGCVL